MAYGNIVKDGGQVLGASAVDSQISALFRPADPMHANVTVVLSAAAQTTGITFALKDSYDAGASFFAVGSESLVSLVKKTFAGGVAEVTDITIPATVAAAQGDYLHATGQDGSTYAVWLDKDAAGTAPSGALYTAATNKIVVSIVTGGTAAANAALFRAAVVANAAWAADFTTSAVTVATMTLTQVNTGAVADPAPKDVIDVGVGSITVSVTTAGSDGNVVVSTSRITSTTHGFLTGDRVLLSGSDVPGALEAGTYYVIKIDANVLKLATTQALALAGTAVTLTDFGSGTSNLIQAAYNIRMIREDATDQAQLPLQDRVIVVANTGASDSCTVAAVYTLHSPV